MKQYHFNFTEELENKINEILIKRAIKQNYRPEKLSELLRNLILEEYERRK